MMLQQQQLQFGSNNSNSLDETDDTVSSSDGSFNPPVLSQYAKELLSESEQAAQAQAEAEAAEARRAQKVVRKRVSIRVDDEFKDDATTCIYHKSPIPSRTNSEGSYDDYNVFNDTYVPQRNRFSNSPESQKTNYTTASSNSSGTSSPNTRFVDSRTFSTPAISRASSANKLCESTARSSRVKRFSKALNLGPPKRTVREEKEEAEKANNQYASAEAEKEPRVVLSHLSPNVSTPTSDKEEPPRRANKNSFLINGRNYQRLEMIGRGGSSKVYKVQASNNKVFAMKKVTFDDVDTEVIDGFKGEINLLERLRDEDRVVKLIDHEMLESSVYLVMECGEIDLAHVLAARLNQPLDISFVRYYAVEMLKCVQAVHKHGIVHSDLKPANFLLVKGMLKIIDFGIANVVPEYTVNVHRDTQIGTPNYMAPEALLDSNSNPDDGAKFKVGRPSDVWSCGCIIYQMVYGKPPYGNYSGPQRMLAIMNPKVEIQYPKHGLGQVSVSHDVQECIQGCLERDPNNRMTIDQALAGSFMNPQSVDKHFIQSLLEHAVQYGVERNEPVSNKELGVLADDVWKRIQALNI